jgi:hypothetical protein
MIYDKYRGKNTGPQCDNMVLQEVGWLGNGLDLSVSRYEQVCSCKMVMNLWVPQNAGNFLTS